MTKRRDRKLRRFYESLDAPADPAEVVAKALRGFDGNLLRAQAVDVLQALGLPSGVSRDATQPTSES